MSTNANIMMINRDKSVSGIYCHWDGYLDYVGDILNQHYQDSSKVSRLMDLGDISSLGVILDQFPLVRDFGFDWDSSDVFDQFMMSKDKDLNQVRDSTFDASQYFTTAYHRDRGEEKSQMHVDSLKDIYPNEFNYLYFPDRPQGDRWYYCEDYDYFNDKELDLSDPKSWHSVRDELAQLKEAKKQNQ